MVLSPNGTASRTSSGSSSLENTSGPVASVLATELAAKRRSEHEPVAATSVTSASHASGRASRGFMADSGPVGERGGGRSAGGGGNGRTLLRCAGAVKPRPGSAENGSDAVGCDGRPRGAA